MVADIIPFFVREDELLSRAADGRACDCAPKQRYGVDMRSHPKGVRDDTRRAVNIAIAYVAALCAAYALARTSTSCVGLPR